MSTLQSKRKKPQKKPTRQVSNVVMKELEDKWRIPPTDKIPEYDAWKDRNCPRARMKKFNHDQKLEAISRAEKGKGASDWIENTLHTNFENVPLKLRPSLRTKAMMMSASKDALSEVEILQKVVVRENLLGELRKLLHHQRDCSNCLNEVVEITKAIRYQTVDIIEDIATWQQQQPTPRPFLFRGKSYLVGTKNCIPPNC